MLSYLIEHDIIDFDVILAMYWLIAHLSSVDRRTRVARFQFQNEPTFELRGGNSNPISKIIY